MPKTRLRVALRLDHSVDLLDQFLLVGEPRKELGVGDQFVERATRTTTVGR
jgi:hypothetical protein